MGALRSFVSREGHGRVPLSHVENGVRLGDWVGRQRGAHRQGQLNDERIAELDSIPGWAWVLMPNHSRSQSGKVRRRREP